MSNFIQQADVLVKTVIPAQGTVSANTPMASPPPVAKRCGCRGQSAMLLMGTLLFTSPVFSPL